MQHRLCRLLVSILLIAVVASSCVLPNMVVFSSKIGTMAIIIEDETGISSTGLYPAPYRYIIRGTGPMGQNFYQQIGSETATIPNLAAGAWDFSIRTWDVTARPAPLPGTALLKEYDHVVTATLVTPDGANFITAGANRRLMCWDFRALKKRSEWLLPSQINRVLVPGDARHLIAANDDGSVWVLRIR